MGFIESDLYHQEIGEKLKELRLKKGLSRNVLAEGICSPSYITRIEKGERIPTSIILRELTNRLGVSTTFLFRAIESELSVRFLQFIDDAILYLDRDDYDMVGVITKQMEFELANLTQHKISIHDMQILRGFACMSRTMLNQTFKEGAEEMRTYLHMTYSEGHQPTDIEFGFMFYIGYFTLMSGAYEEGYRLLHMQKKFLDKIVDFHTPAIYVKYHYYYALACRHMNRYEEAIEIIDHAIDYGKVHNAHYLLRELLFLMGEIHYELNNHQNAKKYLNAALHLNQVICTRIEEYFNQYYKKRLEVIPGLKSFLVDFDYELLDIYRKKSSST